MRKTFIDTLIHKASQNDKIWLLVADVGYNLVEPFRDEFPDRFINVGIAEQNMIGVAAGLALSGKTVFCYSLANFPVLRCFEQIRNDVCYHNLDVKIVSGGVGLTYGTLGASHHATEDVAVMRALPNMTVISPCDPIEAGLATEALCNSDKPAYLRLSKSGDKDIWNIGFAYDVGIANIIFNGGVDITLVSCGAIMGNVLEAKEILIAKYGIVPSVISMHTISPIDRCTLEDIGRKSEVIITIEEHNLSGGLGSAVAEAIADMGLQTKLVRIGLQDKFCYEVGSQEYLRKLNGLDADSIANKVREVIGE